MGAVLVQKAPREKVWQGATLCQHVHLLAMHGSYVQKRFAKRTGRVCRSDASPLGAILREE
eukprot:1199613-Pleurochrysis_carterae.AAC.1